MSRQLKNRIRGFVLLMVFSMNTLAGFACSVGMNMGYNKGHHRHDKEQAKPQEKHHHDHHTEAPEQNQDESDRQQHSRDCCGDVAKLSLTDKSVVSTNSLEAPRFLIAFVSHFLVPEINAPSLLDNTTSYSLRRSWNLHDHTDLRIVIQSFQI